MGSLVNTLTLYQHTDLRLEAFARQLSEEWDVSIFLDFLIAQNLCLQVRGVDLAVEANSACNKTPHPATGRKYALQYCTSKLFENHENICAGGT